MPEKTRCGPVPEATGPKPAARFTASAVPATDSPEEAVLGPIERRVAAQAAALAGVRQGAPVPREVLALLAITPGQLDLAALPPASRPRLVAVHQQLGELIADLAQRRGELGDRLACARASRHVRPAPRFVDYNS